MSRTARELGILALVAALGGCSEERDVDDLCAEAPDAAGALPVDIEGASWGQTFCAIYEGGGVRCWGDNSYGQIGPVHSDVVAVPLTIHGIGCAVDVGMAATVTCVLLESGSVRCLGSDSFGEVGNGRMGVKFGAPTTVADLDDAADLTGFGVAMSALRRNGSVVAWGSIASIQADRPETIQDAGKQVVSYGLFGRGGCAVSADKGLTCWGGSMIDPQAPYADPFLITEVGDARYVTMHADHACVTGDSGALACWGSNTSGELGDGTQVDRDKPTFVEGVGSVLQVVLGYSHVCARRTDSSVWCWGNNFNGPVGPHGASDQLEPVQVPLPSPTLDIASAGWTTCALDVTKAVWCWGSNERYELGTGELIPESFEPHRVLW